MLSRTIAEQGPASYPSRTPVVTIGPIGTHIVSLPPISPIRAVGPDPVTWKPVYRPPAAAAPTGDHVSTISVQSGDKPAPTPAVGTVSPQASAPVPPVASAPQRTSWGGLAIFAGVIILLWMFAGLSLRRFDL